jgi:chemotaxis protein histidine kinase CheA
MFRLVHSIKGNSGFFGGLHTVRQLTHLTEDVLSGMREAGRANGEELALVAEGSQLIATVLRGYLQSTEETPTGGGQDAFARKLRAYRASGRRVQHPVSPASARGVVDPRSGERATTVKVEVATLAALGMEIAALRDGLGDLGQTTPVALFWHQRAEKVLRMLGEVRLVPLHRLFDRLPPTAGGLAAGLGKAVVVETEGGELRVDRALIEVLETALMHLLRNSVDHGIEPPEVRQRLGKPAAGRLAIRARLDETRLRLQVEDDGGGIDPARLRAQAVARKLMSDPEAAALSDQQAIALIFRPGFSTATSTSEVSGRGVGMDAVLVDVTGIGGTVSVQSTPGRGTTVILDLPTPP